MAHRPLLSVSLLKIARAGLMALALAGASTAIAQTKPADGLSDAERAKRDANRVMNLIKFHAVQPAKPTKPSPVAKASAATPVASKRENAAGIPKEAESAKARVAAPAGVAEPPPKPAATVTAAATPTAAVTAMAATAENAKPSAVPEVTRPAPKPPAPAPAVAAEEVRLRLVSYVAPTMNSQLLAAAAFEPTVVTVRLTVEPNGTVSSARAMGDAPRRFAVAAVKAVQQWRFDSIPTRREVDVEVPFKPA